MYKKKPFFIVFEGIEGCGKSFQSKKLFNKLDTITDLNINYKTTKTNTINNFTKYLFTINVADNEGII